MSGRNLGDGRFAGHRENPRQLNRGQRLFCQGTPGRRRERRERDRQCLFSCTQAGTERIIRERQLLRRFHIRFCGNTRGLSRSERDRNEEPSLPAHLASKRARTYTHVHALASLTGTNQQRLFMCRHEMRVPGQVRNGGTHELFLGPQCVQFSDGGFWGPSHRYGTVAPSSANFCCQQNAYLASDEVRGPDKTKGLSSFDSAVLCYASVEGWNLLSEGQDSDSGVFSTPIRRDIRNSRSGPHIRSSPTRRTK